MGNKQRTQSVLPLIRGWFGLDDSFDGLWVEWFEKGDGPIYEGRGADLHCFFCNEFQVATDENRHAPDCVYVRAKRLYDDLPAED